MNEFVAKKLGEVLAFSQISGDTLSRGHNTLVEMLDLEKLSDIEEKNRIHGEAVLKIATEAGVIDITLAKASSTSKKLLAMRELYVGEQWDNATELMEWSGFFEGATIVHWSLVRGCAEGLNDEALLILAEEAIAYHYELIELAESELGAIGQDKAL
jgi:hypothetical protein